MTDDIVARLRRAEWYCNASDEHMGYCNKKCAKRNLPNPDECRAAADEIERLRKELQESEDLLDEYRRCEMDRNRWENTNDC